MKGGRSLLMAAALCAAGCAVQHTGPTQHDFQAIDRDDSEFVRVNLRIGAGVLRLDTGTDKLAAADFAYNVTSMKPDVRYSKSGGSGELSITEPGRNGPHIGRVDYEWDLRLNREVPLDIGVEFGAGEARMDLGGLTLRGVDVRMGVGKLDLDLRGRPQRNYNVRIRGGVGEAVVHLPSNIGVEAETAGGIGSIEAPSLRHSGNRYYNDAWEDSKVRIHLDVQGGVGSIRLLSE